jgi:CRISPR-associated protein Cmr2
MPHLFLVSIGPVQGFIASARRSRDLWFGSWLLSELAKAAAKSISDQKGSILIFPAPADLENLRAGSELNVPNKILARVPVSAEELPSFAIRVEDAIGSQLHKIRDIAYQKVIGPFAYEVAVAQVEDLLEYTWAAVPLEGNGDEEYPRARACVEAVLASRKATRDFRQVNHTIHLERFPDVQWSPNQPKSSLDGQRESVIPENAYPSHRASDEVQKIKIDALYKLYGAGPAERLSGVDLLKRHGNPGEADRFPSTSDVAAGPLLVRMVHVWDRAPQNHAQIIAARDAYIRELTSHDARLERRAKDHPVMGHYPPDLLFVERLVDLFPDLRGPTLDTALQSARPALREFLRVAADGKTPIPYYVLLQADGDGMGDVISRQRTQARHQELSRQLDAFAAEARKIVSKYDGALVYAGGDDVLAFLPLHTALPCAVDLAQQFRDLLARFKDTDEPPPSLSVGLAVCHHLDPLSDALDLARNAERGAKNVPGKNALAVTLSKRSGVDTTVAGSWEGTPPLHERLLQFTTWHRQNVIPDGAAYELRSLADRLPGAEFVPVVRLEAARVLKRKRPHRGQSQLEERVLKYLTDLIHADPYHLKALTQANTEEQSKLTQDQPSPLTPRQLAAELIVAREFARAYDLAEVPLPPKE